MAKVLITGANGFIGSHLVEKFIAEGHEVHGLVRKTSDLSLIKDMNVSLRIGDVTDYDSMIDALKGIEILVHNAGLASDWGSLDIFRKINLEGTKNTVKAAKSNDVRRVVQISSTAIHGFNHAIAVKEDEPKNPVFNYSISKLEAEDWIFEYGKEQDLEITAIRPGNVFGPRDHTFIEKYIEAMISRKVAYVNGGKSMTCPTYIENLVHGIYLASQKDDAVGESFIITDGLDVNWKEFTDALADNLNIKKVKLSIPLWLGIPIASLVESSYKLVSAKNAPLITK